MLETGSSRIARTFPHAGVADTIRMIPATAAAQRGCGVVSNRTRGLRGLTLLRVRKTSEAIAARTSPLGTLLQGEGDVHESSVSVNRKGDLVPHLMAVQGVEQG
jgi:hypothetical protein